MEYTIRSVPKDVDIAFRARAKAEGKTLNDLAIEALAQRAGINDNDKPPKRDLSFMGKLSAEDAQAIEDAHEYCESIGLQPESGK